MRFLSLCVCESEKRKSCSRCGVKTCAHMHSCMFLQKKPTCLCVPLQARAGLLCSSDKLKIHEPVVLTCCPKAGAQLGTSSVAFVSPRNAQHTVINNLGLLIIWSAEAN